MKGNLVSISLRPKGERRIQSIIQMRLGWVILQFRRCCFTRKQSNDLCMSVEVG